MKIMFVCTGNICRSAMAEYILKDRIEKEEELKQKIEVFSAGTYAEDGETPTYSAIEVMKESGIDMAHHKATNIRNNSKRTIRRTK